jgi:REP element-mobilizing transposase RayT
MVLAYHLIFGAYGFWLPNDPRGSWSDFVASWELFRFGGATKTDCRHSVAHIPHDQARRLAAKEALKYPPVQLTGVQARAVGAGFRKASQEAGYRFFACAILPEHVHVVLARHDRHINRIVAHLKSRATHRLREDGLWHADNRPVWADGSWKVYINSIDALLRAIEYVENNPIKEGKPRQRWSFVEPFITGI